MDNQVEHFGDSKKPAWKCGNRTCQGGSKKKQGDGNWPWASWNVDEFAGGSPVREDGTPQEFDRETGERLWPPGEEPF